MSPAPAAPAPLKIAFSPDRAGTIDPGLPVLAGESLESIFLPTRPAGQQGNFRLFRNDDWLIGAATVDVVGGLEALTHRLYLDMFQSTRGSHLARIWHYVPAINEPGPSGLENYQAFCRGRSLAFEQHLGAQFKESVPAASAVGCKTNRLTVIFAACQSRPRHVENPLQVPAYEYPADYGPRAPSFARASIVRDGSRSTVFISGTAAISGHATVTPYDTTRQVDCTLANLREISLACGLTPHLLMHGTAQTRRHFKVYLRHAEDQGAVAATLNRQLFLAGDVVSYLHADICRAPLTIEIEATLSSAPPPTR